MQAIENNKFFSPISNEEAANLNGGGLATAGGYLALTNAIGFPIAGSATQLNTALQYALNAQPAPSTFPSI